LSHRGPIEMLQPVAAHISNIGCRAPVELNRSADRAQLQLIAHANAAPVDQSLGQRDLKLAGHLGHRLVMALVKPRQGSVLDWKPDTTYDYGRRRKSKSQPCSAPSTDFAYNRA
jgi:hypothetical protein